MVLTPDPVPGRDEMLLGLSEGLMFDRSTPLRGFLVYPLRTVLQKKYIADALPSKHYGTAYKKRQDSSSTLSCMENSKVIVRLLYKL